MTAARAPSGRPAPRCGRPDAERILITWQQPVWRGVNTYWFATVLRMAHLAGDDPDSVRCVFWFT